MAGGDSEPRIVPIRGGYLKVKADRSNLVKGNLYPVPDPDLPFLGAHLTKDIDGRLLIGPTAMLVAARDAYRLSKVRPKYLWDTVTWPGTWRMIARHRRATIDETRHSISPKSLIKEPQRLLPGLRFEDVEAGPAGIRAQAQARDGTLSDDFMIEKIGESIHVRNVPSPAATSSLALAKLIAKELTPG
jgi:L-2-hydroxyglutarate oxidase